jgi:uncharacterized protein YcbK (DUF882 family)
MGDLSNNFSRHEFACKCGCGFDTVDVELIPVLQALRDYFARRVTISSGCRCGAYNYRVGGSGKSQHTFAKAADISVQSVAPSTVHHYLDKKYESKYGIGLYQTFTHIDVRKIRARW